MVSSLLLISDRPVPVSGRTIFKMTKNIMTLAYLPLNMYDILKEINFHLVSVVGGFIIYSLVILYLRSFWVINPFLAASFSAAL